MWPGRQEPGARVSRATAGQGDAAKGTQTPQSQSQLCKPGCKGEKITGGRSIVWEETRMEKWGWGLRKKRRAMDNHGEWREGGIKKPIPEKQITAWFAVGLSPAPDHHSPSCLLFESCSKSFSGWSHAVASAVSRLLAARDGRRDPMCQGPRSWRLAGAGVSSLCMGS